MVYDCCLLTHFFDCELAVRVHVLDPHSNRPKKGKGLHRAGKTTWPSSPLQKSLIWRKLAGEWRGGSLAFEVQIPVEMDLICTYHASLQQDRIMPEIWTQIWTICFSSFFLLHKTVILFVAFDKWKMYCFLSAILCLGYGHRVANCHKHGKYICVIFWKIYHIYTEQESRDHTFTEIAPKIKAEPSNSNESKIHKTNFSCKLGTEGLADWIVQTIWEATTGEIVTQILSC